MPILEHSEFGAITYQPEEVYAFDDGLPGFDGASRFLLHQPARLAPLVVLLSLDKPGLRFYALPLDCIAPDLRVSVSEDERAQLGLGTAERPALGLALVTWLESEPPSANLLAPVLLHPPTCKGVQSIQFGSGYDCRYPLIK